MTAAEFVVRFHEAFGYRRGLDIPEDPRLMAKGIRAATTTMTERPPWEAEIPLDALADAGRPRPPPATKRATLMVGPGIGPSSPLR